ncbi:MAG: hypothetical protein ACLP9L_08285 [Thermoguttaceae bacterium]
MSPIPYAQSFLFARPIMLLIGSVAIWASPVFALNGQVEIHDPSTVIQCNGIFYTYGTGASNAWGGDNWASTSSAGISGNEYITFGFTVSAGYSTSLSSISLNYRHSSTGPSNGYWQYQVNAGSWGLIGDFSDEFSSTSSSGAAITPISLTWISALQNLPAGSVVDFRLVPYGATSTAGTWYVYDDGGNNTNDLVVTAS